MDLWKQISLDMHLPGLVLRPLDISYGLQAGQGEGLRLTDLLDTFGIMRARFSPSDTSFAGD